MAKTYNEVITDIESNIDKMIEDATSEELRLLAEEIKMDLQSTGHLFTAERYRHRGHEMNRLAIRNQRLERENKILLRRLAAIDRIVAGS
jgi:hypothetical protein